MEHRRGGPDRRHRRSIRLPNYDYRSSGAYFLTLCSYERACLFGEVVDGHVRLSRLGEVVDEEWRRTGLIRSDVELDEFVVMPNHLHAILILHQDGVGSQPDVGASRRLALSPRRLGPNRAGAVSPSPGSIGAILAQFKSAVTKRARSMADAAAAPIWQRNYYERVIRNESELGRIRQYIAENPARWADDEDNPNVWPGRR